VERDYKGNIMNQSINCYQYIDPIHTMTGCSMGGLTT
jgi:hypothetical protein